MFPQHALSDGLSAFTLPVVNNVGLVVLDGFSNFSRNLKALSDTLMPNTENKSICLEKRKSVQPTNRTNIDP